MHLRIAGIAVLLTGIVATVGLSQEKSTVPAPALPRNELDTRITKIIFDAEVLGTELYNTKKNYEGCYRLYQGTVMAVLPLLDQRPKLQQSVRTKLEQSKTMGHDAVEAATLLRGALDDIQNDIAPLSKEAGPKTTPPGTGTETVKKTLWDRLGGTPGVNKIVDYIVKQAPEDMKVKFMRGDKKLDLQVLNTHLVEYVSSITGGPLKYTGKDMKTVHAGMKITDKEFDAFAAIIEEALNKQKEKIAPDAIKEFMALIEGTRKDIVTEKTKQ